MRREKRRLLDIVKGLLYCVCVRKRFAS